MRIRVAGIIPMKGGYALMHRTENYENEIHDYYVFPGGGLEDGETLEQGVAREIKEEFGIEVKVKEKIYEIKNGPINKEEYFFLCEYISGKLGTGEGPEFNNNPKYINRGKYFPTIVKKEEIENLVLFPIQIKDKFVEDVKNGKF